MHIAKRKHGIFLLAVLVALATLVITASATEGGEPALWATPWALLPPVIAIGLALITKEVYSSLFLGIIVGSFMVADFSVVGAVENFFGVMIGSVSDNLGIVIFLIILGTIVALMIRAGGSKAYGDWARNKIKTRNGAMLATMALGIVLGVDDYFNNLTTGNVMRPVTDGHNVSRAKLAYICDATAAPVCIMMPVSSWAAAVSGIVEGYDGFQLFIQAIPYNFYAILTLIMVFYTSFRSIDYGPMRTHEVNAVKGDLYTTPDRPYAGVSEMKFNPNGKVIDLVIPVIILIIGCVAGLMYTGGFFEGGVSIQEAFANCSAPDGLSRGSFVSLLVIFVFYIIRRSMKFTELMDCLPEGFKQMVPALMILTFAWTISGVTKQLGAREFVAGVVASSAGAIQAILPCVIFLIACGLAFATGTSWGTFGILIPIVVAVYPPVMGANGEPMMGQMLMVAIGACLAGAVCGDHCSPISDTTIMASTGAQSNHINHVQTQLPYALTVAAVSAAGYLLAGFLATFGMALIALPVVIVVLLAVLTFIGKSDGATEAADIHAANQASK